MIGKKVPNPRKSASKVERVDGLGEYIEEAQDELDEKCVYYNGRGFISQTPEGHRAEMLALSQEATRSKDPINHYVLSWQQGERPTEAQVEQAVDILLREMGLVDHQALYGLHVDTDNVHLHVAVNRVHPVTERPVRINNGFDKEALHRALAHIEHVQGWSHQQRGRYRINERGEAERVPRTPAEEQRNRPQQARQDVEHRTGEKSAERIGIEEAAPVIEAAQSWPELHVGLAARGMRYERKGSGAIVWVGDVAVKASAVARGAGLGRLEKRLGPFQEANRNLQVADRVPAAPLRPQLPQRARQGVEMVERPLGRIALEEAALAIEAARSWSELHERLAARGIRYERKGSGALVWVGDIAVKASEVARGAGLGRLEKRLGPFQEGSRNRNPRVAERRPVAPPQRESPGWNEYVEGRRQRAQAKAAAWAELRERATNEREQLKADHRQQRANLQAQDWRGKGQLLNAMRSVLAAEQAAQRAALRERQLRERKRLWEAYPPYPSYGQWQEQRAVRAPDHQQHVSVIHGHRYVPPAPQDIRAFVGRVRGAFVDYRRRNTAGKPQAERVAFTDLGQRIDVYDHQDKAAVRAVLQLASQKWGSQVWVRGNERYLALCVELAATEGFTLQNPELQARIQLARERERRIQSNERVGQRSPTRTRGGGRGR